MIVYRFGKLREVARERGEDLDRFSRFVLFYQDQSPDEATLGVLRLLREILIDPLKGLSGLALLQESVDILKLVRAHRQRGNYQGEKRNRKPRGGPSHEIHCAILFLSRGAHLILSISSQNLQ